MANRSSDDPKWCETKKIVDKRDKRTCQFERCLSAKEFYQVVSGSPKTLDRAHILAASAHPEHLYNIKNVITLRRFIHQRMDEFRSPLNGQPIELNEHFWWWLRILQRKYIEYDVTKDYELLLMQEIK